MTWWLGDAAGALIVGPAVLLWAHEAADAVVSGAGQSRPRRSCSVSSGWRSPCSAEGFHPEEELSSGVLLPAVLCVGGVPIQPARNGDRRPRARGHSDVGNVAWLWSVCGRRASTRSLLLLQAYMVDHQRDDPRAGRPGGRAASGGGPPASARGERSAHGPRQQPPPGFFAWRRRLKRSQRTERAFALVLLDLDGLKGINDRYGHAVGSLAVCRVAEALFGSSRGVDTAGALRWRRIRPGATRVRRGGRLARRRARRPAGGGRRGATGPVGERRRRGVSTGWRHTSTSCSPLRIVRCTSARRRCTTRPGFREHLTGEPRDAR